MSITMFQMQRAVLITRAHLLVIRHIQFGSGMFTSAQMPKELTLMNLIATCFSLMELAQIQCLTLRLRPAKLLEPATQAPLVALMTNNFFTYNLAESLLRLHVAW